MKITSSVLSTLIGITMSSSAAFGSSGYEQALLATTVEQTSSNHIAPKKIQCKLDPYGQSAPVFNENLAVNSHGAVIFESVSETRKIFVKVDDSGKKLYKIDLEINGSGARSDIHFSFIGRRSLSGKLFNQTTSLTSMYLESGQTIEFQIPIQDNFSGQGDSGLVSCDLF